MDRGWEPPSQWGTGTEYTTSPIASGKQVSKGYIPGAGATPPPETQATGYERKQELWLVDLTTGEVFYEDPETGAIYQVSRVGEKPFPEDKGSNWGWFAFGIAAVAVSMVAWTAGSRRRRR